MQITVTMEKMLCAKPDGKWYFFRGCMGGDGQPETSVICKGSMSWEPGIMETLSLTGEWTVYKGERQFQFRSAKLTLPMDPRSQLHYVCARTNGIGPSIEQKIWDLRKEEWRSLEPGEIPRLPGSVLESFRDQIKAFDANGAKAEAIAWMLDKGCTEAMAAAAWEAWKENATGKVNENCYCLAGLPGFSFRNIDERVRQNFGIGDEDPRRIRSAAIYAMHLETSDGSTAVNCLKHLAACAKLLPNIGEKMIVENVRELKKSGKLRVFEKQNMMALDRDARNEQSVAAYISEAADKPEWISDTGDARPRMWAHEIEYAVLTAGERFTPDETQIDAVRYAVSHKFAVINGGAGVGKTTVIRMIVRGIEHTRPNLTVKLCAPTGKAAARLKEASGIVATTIHTMLGYQGDDKFSAGNLESAAVIIDEASMVDSALLAEVVNRKPAKLILVGDQAQLTPVGKGQPFHDVIQIYPGSVRTLTKCYRNTEAVFHVASLIRNGNLAPRSVTSENERWTFVSEPDPAKVQEIICAWAEDGILDFETDILLCPKNGAKTEEGYPPATVNALNEALLEIDRRQRGTRETGKFVSGDRVINTVNNAEKHIWNGTTGTVKSVNWDDEVMVTLDVPYREGDGHEITEVLFDKDMVKGLRYAYALTIHKSQGSQYRKVIMAILTRDKFQLDQSLIYTGVTRTKEECVVIGDYGAFADGINATKTKTTVLQCLMREEQEKEQKNAI